MASKHALYGYLNCLRADLRRHRRQVTLSIGCPYAINTTLFVGYHTRLEKLLPTLDQDYVGLRLVREFLARKEICFVGRKHAWIMKILVLFPTWVSDLVSRLLNSSNFEGRKVHGRADSQRQSSGLNTFLMKENAESMDSEDSIRHKED